MSFIGESRQILVYSDNRPSLCYQEWQIMKGHAVPKIHISKWKKPIWKTCMVSDYNYMALGEVAGGTAWQSTQEATGSEMTSQGEEVSTHPCISPQSIQKQEWTLVQTGFWVTKTIWSASIITHAPFHERGWQWSKCCCCGSFWEISVSSNFLVDPKGKV